MDAKEELKPEDGQGSKPEAQDLPICETPCSECGMRDGCEKSATLEAMQAAEELGSTKMSLSSLLVFGFPMAGAILGCVAGSRFGVNGEVAGGLAGFVLTALVSAVLVRHFYR